MTLHFRTGQTEAAFDMVKRFHYLRRFPANVQLVGTLHSDGGLFGDFGDPVAAIVFSTPPTRWSEDVLELSRLVRMDERVPLTQLIARAADCLKRQGHDLLVSFADWTQGHHGGVYQAASWNFAGKRDRRMDGLIIDGCFWPGRSCNSKFGTQSPAKVTAIIGRDVTPHFDEGKYLYWRALNKAGLAKAKRLGLDCIPYPKPMREAAE